MSDPIDNINPASATQKLAALVAQRKLKASGNAETAQRGKVQSDRMAAARSASKSKPALRK